MRRLHRLSILAACVGASVAFATTGVATAATPGASTRLELLGPVDYPESLFTIERDQVATPKGVRERVGSVLVKFWDPRGEFNSGGILVMRRQALDAAGAQPGAARRVKGLPNVWRVPVDEDASPSNVARAIAKAEGVAWAIADVPATTDVMPNDPFFSDLWGLSNTGQQVQTSPPFTGLAGVDLGALGAWGTTQGAAGVSVAVVDSGIVMDHPDLKANLRTANGRNFEPDAEGVVDPLAFDDANSHGTHVAGTIGAVGNNGLGVAGVNWTVDMTSVRTCDFSGSCGTAPEGMAYAGGQARVVNVSLGGPGRGEAYADAIRQNPSSLFVVAAGNDGNDNDETPQYPCNVSLPNVLCVAAIDASGDLASFSNYGEKSVDIAAPGVNILSTVPTFVDAFAPTIEPNSATPPLPAGWPQDPDEQWTVEQLSNGLDYINLSASAGDGLPSGDAAEIWAIEAPGSFAPIGQSCRMEAFVATDLNIDHEQLQLIYVTDRAPNTPVVAGGISGDTKGGFEHWQVDLSALRGADEAKLMFVVVRETGDPDRARVEVSIAKPVVKCIVDQPAGGSYEFKSGTSMASPQVAGAAALLLAKNPTLTAAQLKKALLSTAVPMASLTGKVVTGGRLDANAALASIAAAPAAASASPGTVTGEVPCVATGTAPADATSVTQKATSPLTGSTVTGKCTIKASTGTASSTYACTMRLSGGTWIITTTASTPSGKLASFSKRVTVATRPVPVTG